ncbi:biotin--[acetyl-CoA-carboxylase] ligase [Desulfotignum phosphitoxidans]|jgi:BirA family biotin operon repressor/biotin-[acetyl-CoA-carboxylase] ligase|nr:biotin--[acetyl-CoA-carboxylase] ligase [Desulfotignum phosphitoxidans]
MMDLGIPGLMPAHCCGCSGFVVPVCESTMNLAWHLHNRNRFPEYAWILAHAQTRARGRQGRVWVSEPGSLAVTLRLPDTAENLGPLLSMATALPLIRALADIDIPACIKWPNDILVNDRKAGGILIEEKQGVFMAGIGMNIRNAPENSVMENFFHLPAGCLNISDVNLSLFDIWRCFLKNILDRFSALTADPAAVVREVNTALAWKNEPVVLEHTKIFDGPAIVLGVDDQGRLEVRTNKGIVHIRSGTVTPRVT